MDIYKNEPAPQAARSSRPLVPWRVTYWRRRVAVEGVGMRLVLASMKRVGVAFVAATLLLQYVHPRLPH